MNSTSILVIIAIMFFQCAYAESQTIYKNVPNLYHNLKIIDGILYYINPETLQKTRNNFFDPVMKFENVQNPASGTDTGIKLDFQNSKLNGTLYYGLYQSNGKSSKYPIYLDKSSKIISGISNINILKNLSGRKDISKWQTKGFGKLGYRICDNEGRILYDGKLNFAGVGPFSVLPGIVEGPFINCVTEYGAVISFRTNESTTPEIIVNGIQVKYDNFSNKHEIKIGGLIPDTQNHYTIRVGKISENFSFKTNPARGSREKFSFAFSSDSRHGFGGGERNIHGVNSYIMKKSSALADFLDVAFFQFTGDMISGYSTSYSETLLQYSNWKRTIEPFASKTPYYVGMGNHESMLINFPDNSKYGLSINSFPFENNSSESAFIESFVNFENGPVTEDSSKYDIDLKHNDYPPYSEQVYHYTYDNVAVIVLNSNYLYTASINAIEEIGGNLHGYIMDNQLKWLAKIISDYEQDDMTDHIFVTIHTPIFPNGGHSRDGMWYLGDNDKRPWLYGKPVEKGIIERRDEFLDIICNKSTKVLAVLTGDEHNYSRMFISDEMQRYPESYDKPKLKLKRGVWQIVNGAAGAPYYGQEVLPWSSEVKAFTAEHVLCIFNIDGKEVRTDVYNPETLDLFESVELRK